MRTAVVSHLQLTATNRIKNLSLRLTVSFVADGVLGVAGGELGSALSHVPFAYLSISMLYFSSKHHTVSNKLKQEGWLSPTKRASAAKIN